MAKLRVLKSRVISGGSAQGLEDALTEFYLELAEASSNAELLMMIRVADWAVLITYTE